MQANFTSGEGAWGFLDRLAQMLEEPPKGEERGEVPTWAHRDIILRYPTKVQDAEDVLGAWVLHYDGGCREKLGSGGFILLDPQG